MAPPARPSTCSSAAVGDVNGGAETDDGDQAEEDEDGENGRSSKKGGFNLPFDVVRRFAQPLGIHLPEWEGRVIETAKGVVRLIPVAERTKQLFGDDGVQIVASRVTQVKAGPEQLTMALFPESDAPRIGGRGRGRGSAAKKPSDRSSTVGYQATTLDRVHAAMLLQASGQANALRALLKAEQDRGPEFLRLANALSALYPEGSQEERLLDAMLLAVPR